MPSSFASFFAYGVAITRPSVRFWGAAAGGGGGGGGAAVVVEAIDPGLLCDTDATASGSGWATWTSSALASCLTCNGNEPYLSVLDSAYSHRPNKSPQDFLGRS